MWGSHFRLLTRVAFCVASLFCLEACRTYYFAHEDFNRAYQAGNFEESEKWLEKHTPRKNAKDKLLYFANLGLVQFLQNKTEASNQSLEQAFLLIEDYEARPQEYVASFLTNPNRITYTGERHERLLLNYFKALNQAKANNEEGILVEARRLIRRLNVLEDNAKKNDYQSDGFILWVTGMLFESVGEANNAFIYYRKAHEVYQKFFAGLCHLQEPAQLKKDLVRAAIAAGFDSEGQAYSNQFNAKDSGPKPGEGTVLLLWHKGLGPVKDESRITFEAVKGAGGALYFTNEEYGFSFPMIWPALEQPDPKRLDNIQFVTMALPKYVDRKSYWSQMTARVNDKSFEFQLATDLSEVAKADLHDRFAATLATAIGRVAIKEAVRLAATKATESAVQNSGKNKSKEEKEKKAAQADLVGSLVNLSLMIANAATERADTRNWQTLPDQIQVLRLNLPAGSHTIMLNGNSSSGKTFSHTLNVEVKEGQTHFHTIQTF